MILHHLVIAVFVEHGWHVLGHQEKLLFTADLFKFVEALWLEGVALEVYDPARLDSIFNLRGVIVTAFEHLEDH